jgi:hypothetical protein
VPAHQRIAAISEDNNEPSRKRVLRWRGLDEANVLAATDIMPGDIVVVPSTYGGCDKFGWNPASTEVSDIGDAVAYMSGRRPVLRLAAARKLFASSDAMAAAQSTVDDLEKWAAGEGDVVETSDALTRLASLSGVPDWLNRLR